jgi:putative transposase
MCFRLIDAKKAQHPVSLLCVVLGVSRAGYYAWKQRPAGARRRHDDELIGEIRAIHDESGATYGWPRVHAELRRRGVRVSRKRVARLMREAGLSGRSGGARAARRSRCRASRPHPIWCAATSRRRHRTGSGLPT